MMMMMIMVMMGGNVMMVHYLRVEGNRSDVSACSDWSVPYISNTLVQLTETANKKLFFL